MRLVGHLTEKLHQVPALGALTVLLLMFAVACGAAATATPPAATAVPAPANVTKAAPTAMPQPTPTGPAAPVVNPGKVTLMVSTSNTELFDATFGGTVGKEYHKAFHGFLITWEAKDGVMVTVPGIASKWELSNDGKTTTLTIRKGVKFHDGTEVTAEDVLWSLRQLIGPQARDYCKSSVCVGRSTIMDRIEQTGPDQVSVTHKVPSFEFPNYISENAGGAQAGVVMPKRPTLGDQAAAAAYESNPVGAGPVKLLKHVQLEVMSFERFNDHYYQPKNGFPTDKRLNFSLLDLRVVPEEATRVAALRAGEADIARVSLATRKQVEAGGGRLVFSPEAVAFESLLRGCWKPQFPCHDKRVRQAFSYATNRELMRDTLYGGPTVMQVKGWWVVTPSTIGYKPELDPWPFDPAKARQLLAEAGYPGGKGFGKLIVNTYEDPLIPSLPESAQLAADLWKRELGLDVAVNLMDKVSFNRIHNITIVEFDGQVSWGAQNTRGDAASIIRSYYLTPVLGGPSARVHADPEVFNLVEQTLAVYGQPGDEKTFNSTYQRLRDEAYLIQMGYVNSPYGVGPRIVKWEPYPLAEYASALHTITLK